MKAIVPKEVAEVIEFLIEEEGIEKEDILANAFKIYTNGFCEKRDFLGRYANENPINFAKAIVNGYEVE